MPEPRTIPPPVPVKPEPGQFTGQGNSPVLQGFGMADTRVTIRIRSGSGIGVEYLGEVVKIHLDASTLAEMPPGYDGQYWTIVYDPESGTFWRVEAVAGGAIPPHMHAESDVTNLIDDLAIRPIDSVHDDGIYGRQNGNWVSVGGAVQWSDIQNKPATFPPTLPIPMSGVDGLDEALDDITGSIPPPLDAYTKTESDARYVDATGDTMTGDLRIEGPSGSALRLKKPDGSDAAIWGLGASGAARWDMSLGNYETESGGNSGSNLTIRRFADGGAMIGTVLAISRASGVVDFAAAPTVAGVPLGGGGGSTIEVGDTPPVGKPDKTLWWESDTGGLFLLYNDGNSTAWVQVNGSRDAYNPIRLNPQVISTNQTIPTGYNGMTAGPITIASGVTVDVASGSCWTVV